MLTSFEEDEGLDYTVSIFWSQSLDEAHKIGEEWAKIHNEHHYEVLECVAGGKTKRVFSRI